jgi:hypothetical protein
MPCQANSLSWAGSTVLTDCHCDSGFFTENFGKPSAYCKNCGNGTYNTHLNATACSKCAAGLYSTAIGAKTGEVCQKCTSGFSGEGYAQCDACPPHATALIASAFITDCKCDPGYTGDDGGTALFGGERVGKDHERVSAYGAVDEANATIGLAHTDDPSVVKDWIRLPENPVLSPAQPDTRDFEHTTLYKSAIIRDEARTLGAPFVMFYNGKAPPYGQESIGLAISDDLRVWRRLGHGPVINNVGPAPWAISGDPQLAKIGDVWVMFYFGAFWKPGAFDTFAASYDLVHWTKWDGPHLVEPSEPYDKQFAHKPWVLKHEGVVYHFYCAVGDQGRVIALATSKDLRAPAVPGTPSSSSAPPENSAGDK